MSKVFVSLGISLDGFIAGPNRGAQNPLGDGGPSIHAWIYDQRAFRRHLGLGEGGETGVDNRIVEDTFERIGANITGKRMFEESEAARPLEPRTSASRAVETSSASTSRQAWSTSCHSPSRQYFSARAFASSRG